jgi:hypothetical protein
MIVFTQVLEQAQGAGMVKLGHVAIDSTRVRASASRYRMDNEEKLRQERAHYRRLARKFQQKAGAPEPDESGGMEINAEQQSKLKHAMAEMPRRLERLRKSGLRQLSRTDADARFLRSREGWVLGYTPEVAVSDDHFIVAARVTQSASDNASLVPMVEEVERRCRCRPQTVTADSGYFSGAAVREMQRLNIDAYVPDNNLAHEMSTGERAGGIGKHPVRDPAHLRMREKLRSSSGRIIYRRRQAVLSHLSHRFISARWAAPLPSTHCSTGLIPARCRRSRLLPAAAMQWSRGRWPWSWPAPARARWTRLLW